MNASLFDDTVEADSNTAIVESLDGGGGGGANGSLMNIGDDSLECWLKVATFRTVAALGVASDVVVVGFLLDFDTSVRTVVVPISITGSNSKLAKSWPSL